MAPQGRAQALCPNNRAHRAGAWTPWPRSVDAVAAGDGYRCLNSVFLGCAGAWQPRLSVEAVGGLALVPRWGGIAR